jgi:hypothetical protein
VSNPSKVSGSRTLVRAEDFFRADRLLASNVMAWARLAGGCSGESGIGSGGSGAGSSRGSDGGTGLSMSSGSSRWAPDLVLGGIAIQECEFEYTVKYGDTGVQRWSMECTRCQITRTLASTYVLHPCELLVQYFGGLEYKSGVKGVKDGWCA